VADIYSMQNLNEAIHDLDDLGKSINLSDLHYFIWDFTIRNRLARYFVK